MLFLSKLNGVDCLLWSSYCLLLSWSRNFHRIQRFIGVFTSYQ